MWDMPPKNYTYFFEKAKVAISYKLEVFTLKEITNIITIKLSW